jgi:hypothetical protein
VLLLLGLLIPALSAYAQADPQADPLSWVNGLRRTAGVRQLAPDAVLSLAAARWAEALAAAGVISHRGADGSSALDRYRAAGGTEVRVGEILGAGPSLAAIEKGWQASEEHHRLTVASPWTHAGWGSSATGHGAVWVVLFCEKLVEDLAIAQGPQGLVISGRFLPAGALDGLLYSGLAAVTPRSWDAATRVFTFVIPEDLKADYLRLGFLAAGGFRLTNAFTLTPGTGSPAAPARSSTSAASP